MDEKFIKLIFNFLDTKLSNSISATIEDHTEFITPKSIVIRCGDDIISRGVVWNIFKHDDGPIVWTVSHTLLSNIIEYIPCEYYETRKIIITYLTRKCEQKGISISDLSDELLK